MGKRYLWLCVLSVFLCVAGSVNSWATLMFTDRAAWESWVEIRGHEIINVDLGNATQTIDNDIWYVTTGDIVFSAGAPGLPITVGGSDYVTGPVLHSFFNSTLIHMSLPENTYAFGFDLGSVQFTYSGLAETLYDITLSSGVHYPGSFAGSLAPNLGFFGFLSSVPITSASWRGYSYYLDPIYANIVYAQTPIPVPEPGTLLLLGSGLAGLALYRRRMNKP